MREYQVEFKDNDNKYINKYQSLVRLLKIKALMIVRQEKI